MSHFATDIRIFRKIVKNSLGGEVYALSDMVAQMLSLEDLYGPFECVKPGVAGLEDCGSLFTSLETKNMIAETYLVRHRAIIQQALGEGDLENVYWLPGTGNPAGGLTKVRSDMFPFLRLLESGGFRRIQLRPPGGCSLEGVRIPRGALEFIRACARGGRDPVLSG